jgi:oxygen-independent coproporphyrinogen III oxidase
MPCSNPSADIVQEDGVRERGLYLHVPFCLRKCPYCGFFSQAAGPGLMRRYVEALILQLRRMAAGGWAEHRAVTTIFFGGGTPSILPAEIVAGLLRECRSCFASAAEMEISIEVNPATVVGRDLLRLRRAGFNRLSVGVQSLSDAELTRIGRPHTATDARAVIRSARRAGFANINIDLMYGLPAQQVRDWRKTLRAALELSPEHLALYELTIEEGTPFAGLLKQGKLELPPEDAVLEMMEVIAAEIHRAGYHRYEISSYSLPGRECRHNINYWHNGSYIGLGAGAVSCVAGRRYAAVRDVELFCRRMEAGQEPWDGVEELGHEARFRETVIMGLRMAGGISIRELELRFGLHPAVYYGPVLQRLASQGLVDMENGFLRLTPRGLPVADLVLADLV